MCNGVICNVDSMGTLRYAWTIDGSFIIGDLKCARHDRLASAAPSRSTQLMRPTTRCMAAKEKAEIMFAPFQEVSICVLFTGSVSAKKPRHSAAQTGFPESGFPDYVQVKPELAAVSKVDDSVESFARSNYDVSCEVAINEQVSRTCLHGSCMQPDQLLSVIWRRLKHVFMCLQINIEYNISYGFHAPFTQMSI